MHTAMQLKYGSTKRMTVQSRHQSWQTTLDGAIELTGIIMPRVEAAYYIAHSTVSQFLREQVQYN
jgi:hypothetical protein